jgi:ribosomal protein L11 methyltransferase
VSPSKPEWVSVRVSVTDPAARADALAALFAAGSQGVQELADGFLTHVEGQAVANDLLCAVMAAAPDAVVQTAPLDAVDWTEQWKTGIHAQELGKIVIAPPWLASAYERDQLVVIEPGMAFGTGEHATTRGVVRLMQRAVRAGDRVADLGAGSAVLSIAAVRLGAAHVAAIELDPDAIANAQENAERNGVADRVVVIQGDAGVLLQLVAPVRLILANIISSVLEPLLPAMEAALDVGGRVILSGILQEEETAMRSALVRGGWVVVEDDREDIWWSATVARA